MPHADNRRPARRGRSRIDLLADRAPARFRTQAGAAALAVDKIITATQRARNTATAKVRSRPFPFMLTALALGVGVGLLAYKPSRRAIGSVVSNASRTSFGALGRQLAKELRTFAK